MTDSIMPARTKIEMDGAWLARIVSWIASCFACEGGRREKQNPYMVLVWHFFVSRLNEYEN